MAIIIGTNPAGETLSGTDDGDFIVGLEGNDLLFGGAGADSLLSGPGDDTLDGGADGDFLFGDLGNDTLDGGAGDDMLVGGAGDDTYVLDATGDAVGEDFDAGIDLVQSSITYTLGDNVENLTLTGMGNLNGTGNSLDNTITGNSGDNVLDGGAGNDTLIGGAGNDTYVVDSAGDVVTENAGEGTADLVHTSIDYTLGANVENLTLTGAGNINGTGNDLANVITGNDGNNVLTGGAGKDTLEGGDGADVFKYSFNQTQGGGETFRFTDWLSEKYGRNFGDELPDFSPKHQHHPHQHDKDDEHGKDDKHHSRDDDHGKNDHHDKQGKDDGYHSKHGDHDHHHHHHHPKHGGDDGHHAQNSGLTEKFFEKNYTEWLKEVVVPDLLAQGLELDANGNGKIKIDINEDSRNGTPRIEGLTKDQLAEMFGDRDGVILNDDGETEKAFYSNSFTSGKGKDTVTSGDGFDTIVDFKFGEDKLDFSGITKGQFLASFFVDYTQNVDGVGGADTVITITGDTGWSLTLLEVSGHDLQAFAADSIFF